MKKNNRTATTVAPQIIMKSLGISVKEKRASLELTQKALAKKARISISQLSELENASGKQSKLIYLKVFESLGLNFAKTLRDAEKRLL